MATKESTAYKIGQFIGKIVIGIIFAFMWALPIWVIWNNSVHMIFNLSPITYLQSVSLYMMIWCFGRVWKGILD